MSAQPLFEISMLVLFLLLALVASIRARRFHHQYRQLDEQARDQVRQRLRGGLSAGAITHLNGWVVAAVGLAMIVLLVLFYA